MDFHISIANISNYSNLFVHRVRGILVIFDLKSSRVDPILHSPSVFRNGLVNRNDLGLKLQNLFILPERRTIDLSGRKPEGPFPGEILHENGSHSFDRAEHGSVNHNGALCDLIMAEIHSCFMHITI